MFVKKATAQELAACFEKLKEAFGEVEKVKDAPKSPKTLPIRKPGHKRG